MLNPRHFPRYAGEIWRHGLTTLNLWLKRYRHVTWIVGDGRSGTTWLSELINWDARYRDMFEPFHPVWVRGMQHLPQNPYQRPDNPDPGFHDLAESVFTGHFRNGRTDAANRRLIYHGLIIKDVQANLFLAWAIQCFPQIKPIFLIRNPFAVAVSKRNVSGGVWMDHPRDFLKQPELIEDHLKPYVDLIENVSDDFIERQIAIWSVLYRIPLNQLEAHQVHTVFYEDLLTKPEKILPDLLRFARDRTDENHIQEALKHIAKPSKTVFNAGNPKTKSDPITAWRNQISDDQFRRGLEIIHQFGLSHLYGESALPLAPHPYK